jgi:hypothetical protein
MLGSDLKLGTTLCRHVLLAVLAGASLGAPAQAAGGRAAAIEAEISSLSAQVDQLEGARAVRKLQRAFGYYVDRGLWNEAADLFADDSTVEMGMDGVYAGKARIREYLQRLGGGKPGLSYGQLNEHLQLQPKVDVSSDGLTAQGRWRDLAMLGQFGKSAAWGDGVYENTYVKEQGVWKIKALHLYINFVAPFEGGWARLAPAPEDWRTDVARAFPPDRPPTANYRPFPEAQVPPFHYRNPVSGRPYEGRP